MQKTFLEAHGLKSFLNSKPNPNKVLQVSADQSWLWKIKEAVQRQAPALNQPWALESPRTQAACLCGVSMFFCPLPVGSPASSQESSQASGNHERVRLTWCEREYNCCFFVSVSPEKSGHVQGVAVLMCER